IALLLLHVDRPGPKENLLGPGGDRETATAPRHDEKKAEHVQGPPCSRKCARQRRGVLIVTSPRRGCKRQTSRLRVTPIFCLNATRSASTWGVISMVRGRHTRPANQQFPPGPSANPHRECRGFAPRARARR